MTPSHELKPHRYSNRIDADQSKITEAAHSANRASRRDYCM